MTYSSLIILYIADSFGNTISSINLITNLEIGTILQFKLYSRAQLFEGWLVLTQGWILIWISLFLYSNALSG